MAIRLLVLDVDGVLTDGRFLLHGEDDELKSFHARDGLGLRLLMEAGVQVAFLTGRESQSVLRRGKELGVHRIVQGRLDKVTALGELAEGLGVGLDETAYMGDDLVDIPAMKAVRMGAAPADAHREALDAADWIAASPGGHGAVRDLCEHLLRDMGHWEAIRARYCD